MGIIALSGLVLCDQYHKNKEDERSGAELKDA